MIYSGVHLLGDRLCKYTGKKVYLETATCIPPGVYYTDSYKDGVIIVCYPRDEKELIDNHTVPKTRLHEMLVSVTDNVK